MSLLPCSPVWDSVIYLFINLFIYVFVIFLYARCFFLYNEFGIKMQHCYNFHTCRHWLGPLHAYLKPCCLKRTIFCIKQSFCLIAWDGWEEERGQLVRDLPSSADLESCWGNLCSYASEQFNHSHGYIFCCSLQQITTETQICWGMVFLSVPLPFF